MFMIEKSVDRGRQRIDLHLEKAIDDREHNTFSR
jgi:hypothetical protein